MGQKLKGAEPRYSSALRLLEAFKIVFVAGARGVSSIVLRDRLEETTGVAVPLRTVQRYLRAMELSGLVSRDDDPPQAEREHRVVYFVDRKRLDRDALTALAQANPFDSFDYICEDGGVASEASR